jgi:hypothetical protein
MALLEEPILFCKFSINPLTADAKTLLLITGRISAKTISMIRLYGQMTISAS